MKRRAMMPTENSPMIISESFMTQLITSILSVPIVYIPHYHYNYVDMALADLFPPKQGYNQKPGLRNILGLHRDTIYEYDQTRGRVDFETKRPVSTETSIQIASVLKNLLVRNEHDEECPVVLSGCKILLFKNISQLLLKEPSIQLMLQTFAEKYERGEYDERTTIIIVSPVPVSMLPMELLDIISIINLPAPSNNEIETYVKTISVSEQFLLKSDSLQADLCRTLQGMQLFDIYQIMNSVLARTGRKLTASAISLALEEKKRIVKKSGIIEVVDSDVNFDDVGGLDVMRKDMERKKYIFTHLTLANNKKINLTLPKGILIIGMPGCGKSMIAKSIANKFGVSLLRLDISSLMGQYVGQSEENLRRALYTAEAAHPCVLWIDEIEKAFHGANSSNTNENDTLVMRMMGYFLTWMQERKTAVYIVATANDVLRPEFMRRGRFDEVYFVNFPNEKERKAIFEKKINRFKNTKEHPTIFDFSQLTTTDIIVKEMVGHYGGFSGAEIEYIVNMVIENKFVEYVKLVEEEKKVETLPITENDFLDIIKEMKETVMSNQRSDRNNKEKTPVERILEMKDIYNFKSASE